MLTVFQISLTILVALTGTILACAEESPLPALSGPLALACLYVVDWKRLLILPSSIMTALGAFSFLAAGLEFLLNREETPLIPGAHLLVYLTWIVLLHAKEIRHYWWLLALSILQIAVASLFTSSIWFGIGLLAYDFLIMWTLSAFQMYRTSLFLDQVVMASSGTFGSGLSPTNSVRHGYSRERGERLINLRSVGSMLLVTCLSLVISLSFFLFTPRIWSSQQLVAEAGVIRETLTGFTEEVRLGDMGEILENSDPVLSAKVFDQISGQPLSMEETLSVLGDEPLFRGAALEMYAGGRWHRLQSKTWRPDSKRAEGATIRIDVELQPLGTDMLFSFGNQIAASTPAYGGIQLDVASSEIKRAIETDDNRPFRYSLFTDRNPVDTWLADYRQLLMSHERDPHDPSVRSPLTREHFKKYRNLLTELPTDIAAPLSELTRSVVGEGIPDLLAASKIEDWFRESGEFSYTLKLDVSDSAVDPVLDFLLNRRRGHCEYFASSMALMLRTLAIPARVISGFKGGVLDRQTDSLHVQQLHAHAWVEAYIDDHWVTFDPTPDIRNETVVELQRPQTALNRLWNASERNWIRGVRFSRDSQQELLYDPLAASARAGWNSAKDLLQGKKSGIQRLLNFLKSPHRWFSWNGALLACALVLLISALIWLTRRLVLAGLLLRAMIQTTRHSASIRTRRVPFYDRLTSILKRQGILQQPSQTAREFVHNSLLQLGPRLTAHGMDAWPSEVVEQFYRVRFGNDSLDDLDLRDLERRLDDLERCLDSHTVKST